MLPDRTCLHLIEVSQILPENQKGFNLLRGPPRNVQKAQKVRRGASAKPFCRIRHHRNSGTPNLICESTISMRRPRLC